MGAEASLWRGKSLIASGLTDKEGHFEIESDYGSESRLLVFYDDPSTPGADYMPIWLNSTQFGSRESIITLKPATSLTIDGDILFVETNELPTAKLFFVLDPVSGEVQHREGVPLIYGTTQETLSFFLGLEPNNLVVPVGEPLKVRVNCSILINNNLATRSYTFDEIKTLNQGELLKIDSRPYSVSYNQKIASDLLENVEEILFEMESLGFYLVREVKSKDIAYGWLSDSAYFFEEERYVESFDYCKRAYIELSQTRIHLNSILSDAAASVYIIIVFLALTSTTIAFLLFYRNLLKIFYSFAFYASFLSVLYFAYPGSVFVPEWRYVSVGAFAITTSIITAMVFPYLMKGRGVRGHVPVRNIVVPIFSIAKRGMRRRRLRLLLTLSSVTVLVMSFVTLTSFSESYGLLVSKVPSIGAPVTGIMVRAPGEDFEKSFLTMKDVGSGWIERQPEASAVSYKAENLPFIEPIGRLNGLPINGVVGFDPEKESVLFNFDDLLKEGGLPTEGGIVVSEALRSSLGVHVGDKVMFGDRRFTIEGVIDDGRLQGLTDIDGVSYLPSKLINVNPVGEIPNYKRVLCETQEVIITHMKDALEIPLMRISRIDVVVKSGVDVDAFSRRLALERGYWVWTANDGGTFFTRLGSYFEGIGFPLVVPWAIVVSNVIVTMYNSIHERRKEIQILSSIGVNPGQVAAIFVAEAIIIGFVAGGLGYLSGMTLYKGLRFFRMGLEVEQKVSALWSMASIGISQFTILMGTIVALRNSVVITPSLQRRWKIDEKITGVFGPWEVEIPVKLLPEEVPAFTEFVFRSIRAFENHPSKRTSSIKLVEGGKGAEARLDFIYKATKSSIDDIYVKNSFIIETSDGGFLVRLVSWGKNKWSHEVGTLVRMIIMRWSTSKA